jgi:hypothetical protein
MSGVPDEHRPMAQVIAEVMSQMSNISISQPKGAMKSGHSNTTHKRRLKTIAKVALEQEKA